jgi:pyruvate ferredoxin oxidoreductase alpha subunit
MGAFAMPAVYAETKKAQDDALLASKPVILKTWKEYGKLSGRHYSPVEQYQAEDAKVLLLTMGSYSETAMVAVDELRKKGDKVGQLRLRLWRPFPFEELRHAVANAEVLIVLDRCISFGGPPGPVCSEVKAALYAEAKRPKVVGFIGGLGGRDITVKEFKEMVSRGIEAADKGAEAVPQMIGIR